MAPLTIKSEEEKRLKGMGFLNNKGTDDSLLVFLP